jgi:hypothetical protein
MVNKTHVFSLFHSVLCMPNLQSKHTFTYTATPLGVYAVLHVSIGSGHHCNEGAPSQGHSAPDKADFHFRCNDLVVVRQHLYVPVGSKPDGMAQQTTK